MTKENKIIGLEKLNKYDWYNTKPKQPEPKKPLWRKLFGYFDVNEKLRVENIHLHSRLTGALYAAAEAGKTGLSMYYENEQLKDKLDIAQRSCTPDIFNKVWVRKEELDKVKRDLNVMTERCNRFNHQFDEMNTLRVNAEIKLIELTKKLEEKS